MAFLSRACSVVLLTAGASAFPVYDVDDGEPLAVNPLRGTAFTSVSKLGDSRVIECYADYANNGGAGTCKILSVDGMAVTEEGSVVFNANHTQYINVASFSSSTAVVCYLEHVGTEHLTCKFLDVGGNSIVPGEAYVVDDVAVQVSFSSLASLTHEIGIVCWSYPLNPVKDRAGVCNKLTLGEGGNITFGSYTYFDQAYATSDVTVQAFSETSAVVCWSAQGDGDCRTLSLSGSGSEDFDMGAEGRFFVGESEAFRGLALVKFNASRGLVCWADQVAKNRVDCKPLLIDGSNLGYGEAGEVTAFPSLYLTADAISEDAALVCYATDPEGSVLSEDFDGKGTCNIVGLMEDDSGVGAGPPNEVNSGTTQFLAVASFDDSSAVLCYSDGGAGGGSCKALRLAETTTSSTETSTTTETTTTTATTTPHTTTETITVSETSTTSFHTTTETFTTTSAHTTTATTVTQSITHPAEPEDSGSQSPDLLGVYVALLAATGVALH